MDFLAITEHNHFQAGDIANNPQLYTGPGTLSLRLSVLAYNLGTH